MEFFQSQGSLTTIEWVLRAVVSFFFLVIVAKIIGQRAISQLRLLDFVIALVIGNIIAHPLSDEELGLKGSIITTVVLVILYIIGVFSMLKFPWFRKFINHEPITVIKNGEVIYKGLLHARISIDVLLEELRKDKIEDIKKVALAYWEAEGKLSIFLNPKYEPITPETLNIEVKSFDMPRTIIKEGKIIPQELTNIQKDKEWLVANLKRLYQTEVEKVLLATIDKTEKLNVFLYK